MNTIQVADALISRSMCIYVGLFIAAFWYNIAFAAKVVPGKVVTVAVLHVWT